MGATAEALAICWSVAIGFCSIGLEHAITGHEAMRRKPTQEPVSIFDENGFVAEDELAHRWRISRRTLLRWRRLGKAPNHMRLGHRILYRREDIEAFEAMQLRGST